MQINKVTRVIGVDDMQRAIGFYQALGLEVEDQNPHAPVVIAHVVDTEGNVIQLAQPR